MKKSSILFFLIFLNIIGSLSGQQLVFSGTQSFISQSLFRVLEQAYSELGISVTSTIQPAKRALISSDSGKTDGEVNRLSIIEESYSNLLRVDVPLLTINMVGVIKEENSLEITGNNWKNIAIGIRRGSIISEHITEGIFNVSSVTEYDHLFTMLEFSRIDLLIVSDNEFRTRKEKGLISGMKMIDLGIEPFHHYHYLHKANIELIPKIEKILRRMKNSGRIEEIIN